MRSTNFPGRMNQKLRETQLSCSIQNPIVVHPSLRRWFRHGGTGCQTGTGAAEEEGSCGPELQQETPDQLERPKGEIWLWKKGTGTANISWGPLSSALEPPDERATSWERMS
ncbi:hypothetical protein D4764_22G0000440 [Takifugu flavidus]|uniref:Uncharacterized protein n=1 Tax=Takifugu flavidus TaxID=433684 RepID=A0A5C6NFU8_9TELE|nr:hypothetical protein D4764_22G0000440 [Takifugu flavidus]